MRSNHDNLNVLHLCTNINITDSYLNFLEMTECTPDLFAASEPEHLNPTIVAVYLRDGDIFVIYDFDAEGRELQWGDLVEYARDDGMETAVVMGIGGKCHYILF